MAPDFSDSPDGPRKGSQEYLLFKLKRAKEHVEYLKATPLLPSEKGVLVEVAPMATKKKKVVEKRYGSFNLRGLMTKTADARVSLREAEDRTQQRKQTVVDADEQRAKDLLSMQLCLRKCVCAGGASKCVWKHHSICGNDGCGALVYPLLQCASKDCKSLAVAAKKAAAEARAQEDQQDLESFKMCAYWHKRPLPACFDVMCPCTSEPPFADVCKWVGFSLCHNPPCAKLLEPGKTCLRKVCKQYRKDNNIAAPRTKKTKRQTSARHVSSGESSDEGSGGGPSFPPAVRADALFKAASTMFASASPSPLRKKPRRKNPHRTTKEVRLREDPGNEDIVPADVRALNASLWDSDHDDDDKDDDRMSDPYECSFPEEDDDIASGAPLESSGTVTLKGTFEVDSIRLGPNIAGKYLVHWEGYDTDGDTWEPKANLPAEMVEKYMAWRFDDDSDSN